MLSTLQNKIESLEDNISGKRAIIGGLTDDKADLITLVKRALDNGKLATRELELYNDIRNREVTNESVS
jgi:hypothetical protein